MANKGRAPASSDGDQCVAARGEGGGWVDRERVGEGNGYPAQ